jgi:thiol-disulfide isomerase/thioredoxin
MILASMLALSIAPAQAAAPAAPAQKAGDAIPAAIVTPRAAAPAAGAKAPGDGAPALTLSIGSKAPAPEVESFLRGEKPTFFEPGKTYVIEFWATWCGPCKQSMPHLTKLAEELKDKGVVIVGISDEKADVVQRFLDKDEWKQKARYTIGADPDRSTHKAYMEAAGQGGIPTAFIVKEGTVQWIGHPMGMDEPLKQIVAGTYDAKAAKKTFEDAMSEELAQQGKQNDMAKAIDAKDWPTVLKLMDEQIAAAPADQRAMLESQKMGALLMAGRNDEAYALGARLATAEPRVRPWLAMTVLRMPDIQDRRVDVAIGWLEGLMKDDATMKSQPQLLAELGHAYGLKKDWKGAIDQTKAAIEAAKSWGPNGADFVEELKETLKEYESQALKGDAPAKPAQPAVPAGK